MFRFVVVGRQQLNASHKMQHMLRKTRDAHGECVRKTARRHRSRPCFVRKLQTLPTWRDGRLAVLQCRQLLPLEVDQGHGTWLQTEMMVADATAHAVENFSQIKDILLVLSHADDEDSSGLHSGGSQAGDVAAEGVRKEQRDDQEACGVRSSKVKDVWLFSEVAEGQLADCQVHLSQAMQEVDSPRSRSRKEPHGISMTEKAQPPPMLPAQRAVSQLR